ncbi:hypothetical protein ymoll0001_38230 [Yersinia mollaretii ATCC 43969]|uniref:Uncharacterized protein n=1 Tax=Yersinia mollaretii (strain ATCC 43969 / DSM 18520 / CIP 103324 / CNY 7263 / WAIP 204) TaxID=349967 RepID=A0ABM9Y543_YERMW|nr:hypothetical protein ymoll0001_38230 [Yersinia mollaretii ATCC 43969]
MFGSHSINPPHHLNNLIFILLYCCLLSNNGFVLFISVLTRAVKIEQ